MRSQREIQGLSITHKASACLYNALKQERGGSKGLLSSIGKQVVGRNKTTSSMTYYIDRRDYTERIQGQVRGLTNFNPPEKSARIENMIDTQREKRRQRHINCLKDFENWHEKLCENIKSSSEEAKKNWETFAKASEEDLLLMISSFTEQVLLSKDLEYILAGYDNINSHAKKRMNEADKMKTQLYRFESEKIRSVENFLSIMKKQLIDIAFQLPPEIDTFISLKRTEVTSNDHKKQKEIETYTNRAYANEEKLIKEINSKLKAKELFWRKVQHDSTLKAFLKELNSLKYVNPEERVAMFKDLKAKQEEIYQDRVEILESITEIPMQRFTQESLDHYIEKLNTLNDKAQGIYDTEIQKLVNFQKKLDADCDDQLEILQGKLEYFKAEINEPLESLIQREGKALVERLKNDGKALLSKGIKYLEDTDIRAHEVCLSLANYWKSVAKEFDLMIAYNKEEEKKYDLSIASRGDTMDERVDDFEDNFKAEVYRLKRSITLEQLELRLQETFKILDKIATEYRSYTDDTLAIMNSHQDVIINTYEAFQVKVGEKFGLLPITQKEKFLNDIKEKKLKELKEIEEQKPLEEAKKKIGKKEEEPKIDLPVLENWEYKNSKWCILRKPELIIQELLVTEEDKAKEIERKIIEEEAKKQEEEKKIAEEALKKEEAKKGKKPDNKKIEEVKVEVIEIIKPKEPDEPIDPEGNICLSTSIFINLEISMSLTSKLRNRAIDSIFIQRESQIQSTKITDKNHIENTITELDEHLRYLWPRKGKLEVNEFSSRLIEIKRHFSRWDRHLEEITKKKSHNTEESSQIAQRLKEELNNYKTRQEELRKQLPGCVNLAECQGLMRRSKDLELQLFQNANELHNQAFHIYDFQCNRIVFQNNEFIESLQLFENGGNYDKEEVEYYRQKTLIIDKEINDLKEKWKNDFESIMKRIDIERLDPIKVFEKDYNLVIENIAAKDGMGKKYGAPRRSAQEKIRAEMTKCEKAQAGIDSLVSGLKKLIQEYREIYASKSEPLFANRSPSLAIEIRKVLLSLRFCSHKYGLHIGGFKEENLPIPLKYISWREDILGISPSPEEIPLEASRLEILLDPLEDIGVQKNPLNFWQRILEIEKNAREESIKLFQGKSTAVPEFMEKYLKNMKSNTEDFRLKRIKSLRESSVQVIDILEVLAESVINSLWFGSEFIFEQECERSDSKLMVEYEKYEEIRQNHKKMLRPNLSNPSCRQDLEILNKSEEERTNTCKTLIKSSLDLFFKNIKAAAELYRLKLLNNTEVLLHVYDNLFTYDSYIPLPGDEQLEIKRSNIRKLADKKKTGKIDIIGVTIHKKTWPGLPLNSMKLPQDPPIPDSPAILSIKSSGHKAVIKSRNESFKNFSLLFCTKVNEFTHKMNDLLNEEERWNEKWKSSVQLLKVKNT